MEVNDGKGKRKAELLAGFLLRVTAEWSPREQVGSATVDGPLKLHGLLGNMVEPGCSSTQAPWP